MANSPDATPAPNDVPDYMEQMEILHGLNGEEEEFCDDLPYEERERFHLYLLGYKSMNLVADEWEEWEYVPLDDHIVVWHTEPDRVEAMVARGREVEDPRLDERNFTPLDDGAVMDYYRQMDPERQDELDVFLDYAVGKKVARALDRDDDVFETKIVADWMTDDSEDIDFYCELGRDWAFRKAHKKPSDGEPPGSHFYEGLPGPPPTVDDIHHIRERVGDQTWRFERTIYSNLHYTNTQRIIHLFVRVDEYGRVLGRMAVKNQGERSMADIDNGIFTEFNIQQRLSQVGCRHILKALTVSCRPRNTVPLFIGYIYLEWAPFKDLYELIDTAYSPLAARKQIPEPFLWLIFRGMAEALYTQLTGLTIAHDAPSEADSTLPNNALATARGWLPIVHTDIKLGNIVFTYPQDDWYPAYMTPQLIDFGSAFDDDRYPDRNSKKIQQQPVMYMGLGTPGSYPPEGFDPPHRTYGNAAIDVRADIWQMGKVMFELMEQQVVNADSAKYVFRHSDAYRAARKKYYPELEELVQQCVSVNPAARPQLNHILWATKQGLEDWERVVQPVSGEDPPDNFTWPFQREELAVGDDVPWWWWWGKRRRGDDEGGDDDGSGNDGGEDGTNDNKDAGEIEGESHVPEDTDTHKRKRSGEFDAEDEADEEQGERRVFKIGKTRGEEEEMETGTGTDSSAGSDAETEVAAETRPAARSNTPSPPAPVSLPPASTSPEVTVGNSG